MRNRKQGEVMNMFIKSLAGLGIAAALTGMSGGVAFAADAAAAPAAVPSYFSTTEIQVLWGNDFDLRSRFPDETSVVTLTLEHFSTWAYGDNFFFVDIAFDTNGVGSNDSQDTIYGEYYPSLSLSKLSGKSFALGPISDVAAQVGINADGDGFAALLYGARVDLNVPGFNFINLQGYVYDTVDDPFDRDLDTTYQFTVAWQAPIVLSDRVKLVFQGFADLIGDRGQGVKTQFLTQPQLRLDLGALAGGDENKYFVGTEVSYWHNKFGTNIDEFAPQVIGVFKF